MRKLGLREIRNLAKVTQLISGRAGFGNHMVLPTFLYRGGGDIRRMPVNEAWRSWKWLRYRKWGARNRPPVNSKVNLPAGFTSLRMPWLDSAPLGRWPSPF